MQDTRGRLEDRLQIWRRIELENTCLAHHNMRRDSMDNTKDFRKNLEKKVDWKMRKEGPDFHLPLQHQNERAIPRPITTTSPTKRTMRYTKMGEMRVKIERLDWENTYTCG